MSLLDWIFIAILIISTLTAVLSGFIVEVFSLGGLILGLVLAYWNFPRVLPYVLAWGLPQNAAIIVAFAVIALATMIFSVILGHILRKSVRLVGLGWLDRLAGAAFGLVKGAVLVLVVIVVLMAFMPKSSLVKKSRLAPHFLMLAHTVTGVSPTEFSAKIHHEITILRKEKNRMFTHKAGVS